jgi:hypothetical protein
MQQVVDRAACGDWEPAHRMVQAEVETATALEQLGPGWRVLHSLPVAPGPATLAHLVIGPQGLFAISSLPHQATVVDVVNGQARLSAYGSEDARRGASAGAAGARRTATAARAGGRHPGRAPAAVPDRRRRSPVRRPGDHAEVVGLPRLVAHLQAHPRRLTAACVQRLATVAEEPLTWDAPGVECFAAGLKDRYDTVVRSEADQFGSASWPVLDDRVVPGWVTASQPPQRPAASPGLRTASVLMIVLGMASLGTLGLLSPPTLAFGGLTLRHHGGWKWLNDKDAALFLVGMTMAVLPVPFWLFLLPLALAPAS